ncbi:MAG: prenyltransferase, partial [Candidatus Riflemargulisbacteria bacterium]
MNNNFSFSLFMRTVRAPFLTASFLPAFLGIVLAYQQGFSISILNAFLTLIGIVFIHFGSNVMNDYFDYLSGNDQVAEKPSPFSGGSRVIQDKLLSPIQVKWVGRICYLIGILIGLYLVSQSNWRLLVLGIVGVCFSYYYTAFPLKLGYLGIGEIICFIGFGPLIVVGSFFVQTSQMPLIVWLLSIPVGLLVGNILLINEFTDRHADKEVSKKTIVVQTGFDFSAKIYSLFVV